MLSEFILRWLANFLLKNEINTLSEISSVLKTIQFRIIYLSPCNIFSQGSVGVPRWSGDDCTLAIMMLTTPAGYSCGNMESEEKNKYMRIVQVNLQHKGGSFYENFGGDVFNNAISWKNQWRIHSVQGGRANTENLNWIIHMSC